MEWWNNGIVAFHALVVKEKTGKQRVVSAVGVYLPMLHNGAKPSFHHSIIPSPQLIVSAANKVPISKFDGKLPAYLG
jgi:hypothetical protein